jgi:DME family drug/metabolite transporter
VPGAGSMNRLVAPAVRLSPWVDPDTCAVTVITGRRADPAHAWRGLLLVSAAGVVWGTIGPAVQLAHDASGLSPWAISAYRAIAGVLALVVATLLTGCVVSCVALARRRWRRVLVTGVATAVFQLLFFIAVVAVGVSVTTVIALGLAPVLLLVVGSVQRGQPPAQGQVVIVTTALVGLVLVSIAGGGGDEAPQSAALGVLAALGSGTAYAVSTHAGAPLSREDGALVVTTVTTAVAAGVLVPGGLVAVNLLGEPLTTTDAGSWLVLAYLGVVTMAFAYVLLYAGLRSTTSGSAVVATLLEPVTAVLIAVLLLGERPTAAVLVGTALILFAVASLGRRVEPEPQVQ